MRLFVIGLWLVLVAAECGAQDLAYGAYQRGYFLTALREAERRLEDNPHDYAAMTLIGEIYHDGLAVARQDEEAVRWWRLAARGGDPQAAYAYGEALLLGQGVGRDVAKARAELLVAVNKGNVRACYDLGLLALQPGDAVDYAQAARYFRQAADAGDGDAAYAYAILLRNGRGVALDIEEAAKWLQRAADQGLVAAQVDYAAWLFQGVGVLKNEALAAQYLTMAAAKRSPLAQNRLAHAYLVGLGVPRDKVRAALWSGFAKAAGFEDRALDQAIGVLSRDQTVELWDLARREGVF